MGFANFHSVCGPHVRAGVNNKIIKFQLVNEIYFNFAKSKLQVHKNHFIFVKYAFGTGGI